MIVDPVIVALEREEAVIIAAGLDELAAVFSYAQRKKLSPAAHKALHLATEIQGALGLDERTDR